MGWSAGSEIVGMRIAASGREYRVEVEIEIEIEMEMGVEVEVAIEMGPGRVREMESARE
jgi:hypothetical protein